LRSESEHNKQFVVAAVVDGLFNIKGTGHTKKSASQNAAYAALIELKNKGYDINSDKK
jgi:ribonuclease III